MADGGLSNADFRRLLATPRPGAAGGGGGEAGERKQKKPKPQKPFKPKQADRREGGEDGEEGEEGPQYRDRAAERRKGLSTDFEGVPADLVGLLDGSKGADLSAVSYEESKYLGGDVAHTHLVKGLDYALLHKVKADQAAEEKEDEEPAAAAPALSKRIAMEAPKFRGLLGRAVYDFFFDTSARGHHGINAAELFLPRRTAFIYDLEDAVDVPTTLRRSKEDCPQLGEMMLGGTDHAVLERISKIMSYMNLAGGGRKKLKKKEREALLQQHGLSVAGTLRQAQAGRQEQQQEQQEAGPRQPVDDDEDIFGDAGRDYAPTLSKHAAGAPAAAEAAPAGSERRGGYFGAEDVDAGLPPLPGEPHPSEALGAMAGPAAGPPPGFDAEAAFGAYPDTDAAYAAADAASAAAVARQEKIREKERRMASAAGGMGGDDDAYAECYPDYGGGYDMTLVDSDEEGGDDSKAKLGRRDFQSEADWNEYKASGTVPKGLEGRVKVRQQQRESQHQKSKLHSQLGKIAKIMEDKGHGHTAAFQSERAPRREAPEPAGGGDAEGPLLPAKKRRI